MAVTINGTTGVSTPGVANSGNETITGTLAVTGAITGSGLSTTLYPLVSGTAVASTSGTSIDFTSIPSWVKRITVMFNGVSTNGTSPVQIQLGVSGTAETTGYISTSSIIASSTAATANSTTGLLLVTATAVTDTMSGIATIATLGSNIWVHSSNIKRSTTQACFSEGDKTLAGTLNLVRITTVNLSLIHI